MTITKITIEQPLQQLLTMTIKLGSAVTHRITYFENIMDKSENKKHQIKFTQCNSYTIAEGNLKT